MRNRNYDESAGSAEVKTLPSVCEYCGGSVTPTHDPDKKDYAKYHGTCGSCGAEYGIGVRDGTDCFGYIVDRMHWWYVGDGRRTMYYKQAVENRKYFQEMQEMQEIGRKNANKMRVL